MGQDLPILNDAPSSKLINTCIKQDINTIRLSDPGNKQKLDSIVTYESTGLKRKWIRSDKDEYTYNIEGKVINQKNYDWDEEKKQWIIREENACVFDTNGRILQKCDFSWEYMSNNLNR